MLRIEETDDLPVVRQLLQAHEYWGIKRLSVDLVIFNERGASYVQDLQVALESMVRVSQGRHADRRRRHSRQGIRAARGSHHLRNSRRPVCGGARGPVRQAWQSRRPGRTHAADADAGATRSRVARKPGGHRRAPSRRMFASLEFFNGLGGFAAQGREYTIAATQPTPAPWINVIANRDFGFHVSAEGAGFTWARNSRENTLTPWSNDPVTDRPGEVIYLRDEESGELWSPTPAPIRLEQAHYSCTHGFGYTRFQQRSHGLALELTLLVAGDDPVKLCRLRIRNESGRQRNLSVTAYVEWVLGPARVNSAPHVITERDSSHESDTGAQSLEPRLPRRGVCGPRRPTDRMDLRSARISGSPRRAGCTGRAGGRLDIFGPHGRGSRSLQRAARPRRARSPGPARISSCC